MLNYFNYFTEIENFYQSRRKVFTLLTPVDWVIVEGWKDQGIPLELVLKGIDRAFSRTKRDVNHLAYCLKAVSEVCAEQKEMTVEAPHPPEFAADEVTRYLGDLASGMLGLVAKFPEFEARWKSIAESIRGIDASDLRAAEQELSALEEKVVALLKVAADEASMLGVKREVDRELAPLRSNMTVEQLTMMEQQLWRRTLMEFFGVPRLSLFYLI